jgi:glycerol-3-phosphate acyltransferase PlsY
MTLWLLILTSAYLLGSIPFGYLLVRFLRKEDVRATGSGNIGATNVARAGGTTLGLLTLLFDALKGYLAVLLAMHFAPNTLHGPSTLAIAAAVGAVIGHVFPIWLRFKGGKGIATALGVFIALVPRSRSRLSESSRSSWPPRAWSRSGPSSPQCPSHSSQSSLRLTVQPPS